MPTLFLLSFNFFSLLYTVFTYHSSLITYYCIYILDTQYARIYFDSWLTLSLRDTIHEIRDTSLGFAKAHHYSYNYKEFM